MDSVWFTYPLAILAGILAGIINTLAGSGSLVTLPMLVLLGLPAHEANATNRVGVTLQNIVGILTFRRGGAYNLSNSLWLLAPAIPGALLGAYAAANMGPQQMDTAIGIVMVMMLFVILFEPERWLRQQSAVREGRPTIWTLLVFFIIGFYGAFIQAGVGVFLLAAMVLGLGYTLVHANAIKLLIILVVTLVALIIFINSDLINWGLGLLLAIGQSIGAWMAARFATSNKNANLWVRRLLIAVVVVSIFQFFGILNWMGQLLPG
jgi:uncharacterized protein